MAAWDPIYIPTITFVEGKVGEDAGRPDAPTNLVLSNAASTDAYTPRTQAAKRGAGQVYDGNAAAADIGRARGSIAPNQRYPITGDSPPAAPTVTTLAPTTGANTGPTTVTITGTNLSPYTIVRIGAGSGAAGGAQLQSTYVSATSMTCVVPAGLSTGAKIINVEDHGVVSNIDKAFTVT